MAIKVLVARQMRDKFRFVLHLDDTKFQPAPNETLPDERWVLRREWPLKTGGERTAYLADLKNQLKDAAQERIAQLTDEDAGGTALPIEGTIIT